MKMNCDEQEAKHLNTMNTTGNSSLLSSSSTSLDNVEETRQRIDAWMGLGSKSNSKKITTRSGGGGAVTRKDTTTAVTKQPSLEQSFDEQRLLLQPTSASTEQQTQNNDLLQPPASDSPSGLSSQLQRPKGILKAPKYSNPKLTTTTGQLEETTTTTTTTTSITPSLHENNQMADSNVHRLPAAVIKGRVVERSHPVAQPLPQRKTIHEAVSASQQVHDAGALAIEGYTPFTVATETLKLKEPKVSFQEKQQVVDNIIYDDDDDDDDDSDASSIILSSMDELFEMAQRGQKLSQQGRQQRQRQQPASPNVLLDRSLASLETDLEFSCLTPEEYEEMELPEEEQRQLQEEEERRLQYEVFAGRVDAFGNYNNDDGDIDDETATEHFDGIDEPNFLLHHANPNDDDDDDDQALIDVSQPQDDEHDDDAVDEEGDHNAMTTEEDDRVVRQPSEARAFILLWTAITQWVTPHTVSLLEEWKEQKVAETSTTTTSSSHHHHHPRQSHVLPTVADRSDVEASRCAGLHAMLKMNLPRIMDELHQPQEKRRFLDIHLAELLSTFDYTYPISVKMDMDMWRAVTCVFVDMVLMFSSKEQQGKHTGAIKSAANPAANNNADDSENQNQNHDHNTNVSKLFPESAQAAGLKLEEYRYLVQSAITTLGSHQEHD